MTAPVLATTAAQSEAARWDQWRQHYDDSSRRSARQMQLVFAVTLLGLATLLVRALLSS